MDKSSKIAIIGAGISGVTAGRRLQELGYQNITVFEKNQSPGGKIATFQYQGRFYETGAYVLSAEGKEIVEKYSPQSFARASLPLPKAYILTKDREMISPFTYVKRQGFNLYHIVKSIYYYVRYVGQRVSKFQLGIYESQNKKNTATFYHFCHNNSFMPVYHMYEPLLNGLGYAGCKTLPAIYYLTYLSYPKFMAYFKHMLNPNSNAFHINASGFQDMIIDMAKELEVITEADIVEIDRSAHAKTNEVKVTYKYQGQLQQQIFNQVIITTTPDITKRYLDTSEKERFLFSKVKYNTYITSLVRIKGLADKATLLFPEDNTGEMQPGKVVLLVRPYDDEPVYMVYQYGNKESTAQSLVASLSQSIEALGGQAEEIILQKIWPNFFPHVKYDATGFDFFTTFAKLQGQQGTYYIGSLFNFEISGRSACFAKEIIDSHF